MANNFRTNADIKPNPKGIAEPVAIRPVCRNFEVDSNLDRYKLYFRPTSTSRVFVTNFKT